MEHAHHALRPATAGDASAIAELLGQLGYPASADEVRQRLDRLGALDTATVVVADVGGDVVGVVTGHVFPSIHATPTVAWLTTLVVRDDCHQMGIGRQLAGAIEDWARHHGATRLSVTSGLQRDDAHAFYEHCGYVRSGVRLTKTLG